MSPTTPSPLIQVREVSFSDGSRQILQRVNLSLNRSEVVSIVGPNGAGKTTLVKIIVGLLKPTSGFVERAPHLNIGYMPQRLQIDPSFPLTVERFLLLGHSPGFEKVKAMLSEVGVLPLLRSSLHSLSGGEFQRVMLARALLREPQLLVLDEPAQGVDLTGQAELYDLIARIRAQFSCAVLLVSHDLHVVMAKTDTVVCLNQHICCFGTPDMVSRDPAFSALFGKAVEGLAFYTHHHDHHHDMQGSVVLSEDHAKDHPHE